MKVLNTIVVLLMAATVGVAQAEEIKKDFNVQTEYIGERADSFKIKPSDAPKGLYVVVFSGWSSTHPQVAAILQEKLRAKGFVIANKIEDADIGINFTGIGLPLDEVNDQVAHTNKEWVAANIGAAILTGGVSLISTGLQFTGKEKGSPFLSGVTYKGPLKLSGRGRVDSETGRGKEGIVGRKYTADAVNPAVNTALFGMLADDWINEHVESDKPSTAVAVTPASIALVPAK